MEALRRRFRRDDTISPDITRDALDLDETRRLGMRNTRSAREAIAAIKAEQERLRRLRKLLEKQSGRLTPNTIRRDLRFTGGQYGEMALQRDLQPTDTKAMFETPLREIETREQAVHDLWIDLERVARS